MTENEIRMLVKKVMEELKNTGLSVPLEVSARHIHLTQQDVDALFGQGYKLKPKRPLSQPGQFLAEERVTLAASGGTITNVAVLGPVREHTQVEISATDARTLGVKAPLRLSGDTSGLSDICVMAGDKWIHARECVMVAKNHIHMTPADAECFGVKNGDVVSVRVSSARPMTFENVPVRVSEKAALAMHIDFDEANACAYEKNMVGTIVTGYPINVEASTPMAVKRPENDMVILQGVVCEDEVRRLFLSGNDSVRIRRRAILTPLAKDFLRDHHMKTEWMEDR